MVIRSCRKKDGVFKLRYKPFLFDDYSQNEPSIFELIFVHDGTKYLYELTLQGNTLLMKKLFFYRPAKALVFDRNTDPEKQLTSIEFGSKLSVNKFQKSALEANTLWNMTVLSGFLKTNIDNKELRTVTNWFSKIIKNMITPKANLKNYINEKIGSGEVNKRRLLVFLNKADFKIKDLVLEKAPDSIKNDLEKLSEILNKELRGEEGTEMRINFKSPVDEVVFEHVVLSEGNGKSYRLPYKEESQGTQRYYQFSGLLEVMIHNTTIFPD